MVTNKVRHLVLADDVGIVRSGAREGKGQVAGDAVGLRAAAGAVRRIGAVLSRRGVRPGLVGIEHAHRDRLVAVVDDEHSRVFHIDSLRAGTLCTEGRRWVTGHFLDEVR